MDIHVLSAFYRTHFAKTLVHYYEPENIYYYPIMAPELEVDFGVDWMRPVYVKELYPGEQCFRKFNDFLETQTIVDDDYYGFVCDECAYEPGFFDILRQQTAKIVLCSSYRGDTTPKDGSEPHPFKPLIMDSLIKIRIGSIGLGQFFIKGEIFKQMPFKLSHKHCDGEYVIELRKKFQDQIVLLSNWFLFANYLQAGRFTDKDKFLKPHWELPQIF